MSNQHPYPRKVVEAVAKALWDIAPASAVLDWEDIQPEDTANRRSDYLEKAEAALQALWDASRVEHPGQVESIPGDTILTTPDNRAISAQTMQWVVRPADYPAHVIFWGDHDDR